MDRKEKQLQIVLEYNPCYDNYRTWIRTIDDILTFEEALSSTDYEGYDDFTPDFDRKTANKALTKGQIKVYSSKKIELGTFVTPSKMEATYYSSTGKVYSMVVPIEDVAWIDILQGQYAKIDKLDNNKESR
jgi:hypothetical protein